METYQLFVTSSCPYCLRVRGFLDANNLQIEFRDTLFDAAAYHELIAGGGRATVPCLRIAKDGVVSWLYESLDIIEYLREHLLAGQDTGSANSTTGSVTRGTL